MATKVLISKSNAPFYNLALEEWALRNLSTEKHQYLILYVNEPAVVIGRNQNLYQEIDIDYCLSNNITICRRVSGGGTVFHDMGNLNWTFISPFNIKRVNQYADFAKPIIALLDALGLKGELTNRNAIEVNGMKVSGQAQFTNRVNILSHGTLLLESKMEVLQPAIMPDKSKIVRTKASKSVRSTTRNINEMLESAVKMQHLIGMLYKLVDGKEWLLSQKDENDIHLLERIYSSKQWIYDRSPKCVISGDFNVNGRKETLDLTVVKSEITRVDQGDQNYPNHDLLGMDYLRWMGVAHTDNSL